MGLQAATLNLGSLVCVSLAKLGHSHGVQLSPVPGQSFTPYHSSSQVLSNLLASGRLYVRPRTRTT